MSIGRFIPGDAFKIEDKVKADTCGVTKVLQEDQDRTVIFEDLNGGKAVGNLFSTRSKIAEAMKIRPDGIVEHILNA